MLDAARNGCAPQDVGIEVRPSLRVVQAQRFFASLDKRTCKHCGAVMQPPKRV